MGERRGRAIRQFYAAGSSRMMRRWDGHKWTVDRVAKSHVRMTPCRLSRMSMPTPWRCSDPSSRRRSPGYDLCAKRSDRLSRCRGGWRSSVMSRSAVLVTPAASPVEDPVNGR
jgi:hypothetical protein